MMLTAGIEAAEGFRACLTCGLVWGRVPPDKLHEFMVREKVVSPLKPEAGDVDLAGVEEEPGESASAALRGVKSRRGEEEDEEEVTVPSGQAAPAPWGILPALILFPSFILIVLGGLMGYELLHTMTSYQQPRKPSAPLVRGIAKSLDMELKDQ